MACGKEGLSGEHVEQERLVKLQISPSWVLLAPNIPCSDCELLSLLLGYAIYSERSRIMSLCCLGKTASCWSESRDYLLLYLPS